MELHRLSFPLHAKPKPSHQLRPLRVDGAGFTLTLVHVHTDHAEQSDSKVVCLSFEMCLHGDPQSSSVSRRWSKRSRHPPPPTILSVTVVPLPWVSKH